MYMLPVFQWSFSSIKDDVDWNLGLEISLSSPCHPMDSEDKKEVNHSVTLFYFVYLKIL